MAKRRNRSMDDFLYSFLIKLMVSGNVLTRTHKKNTTSRLVYQTNENHDPSWFDYVLTLLGRAGIVKKTLIVEITCTNDSFNTNICLFL